MGIECGLEQKSIDVAKKMLEAGIKKDLISKITELSIEEIKKI